MRNQKLERRRSTRAVSWGIVAMLIALAVRPHAATAQSTMRPHAVRVVGMDYALAAPDSVAAGLTAFHFENRGTKQHEIAVVLARRGTTTAQIIAAAKAGLSAPKLGAAYAEGPPLGALFASPGQADQAMLVSSLERGRDYVIVCTLRDDPTMPQHAELGMFHVVHVR